MKVLIAGTFDNFHIGHQWLCWSAFAKSTELTVILAREVTVKKIKGLTPKYSEAQRLGRLMTEFQHHPDVRVRLGREDGSFWDTIKAESPDLILLGYDQGFNEAMCAEKFPKIKLERCTAYAPEIFKSSKF